MPRSALLTTVASIVLFSAMTLHAQELTEREMLDRLDPSLTVEALRRRVEEVRAEMRIRTRVPNPVVAYTREDAGGIADDFLVLRQDLPVTGQRGFLRRAGTAFATAAERGFDGAHRRLRADGRQAFVRGLVAQEREAVILDAIGELEGLVRMLRAREREGESSAFDRGRAEREQADVRTDLSRARIDLVRARGELQAFLAAMPSSTVLRGSLDPAPVPAATGLVSRTAANRSDVLAATATIEALQFERGAAERLRLPQPAIMFGMKRTLVQAAPGTGYTIAVEVRVPLFDRGSAAVALAQSGVRRADADRDALRARIEAEVDTAWAVAAATRTLAEQYTAEVAAGGLELARIARLAYEDGEQGILELLDAHRVALSGRLRAVDLRGEARAALIDLEFVTGEEVIR